MGRYVSFLSFFCEISLYLMVIVTAAFPGRQEKSQKYHEPTIGKIPLDGAIFKDKVYRPWPFGLKAPGWNKLSPSWLAVPEMNRSMLLGGCFCVRFMRLRGGRKPVGNIDKTLIGVLVPQRFALCWGGNDNETFIPAVLERGNTSGEALPTCRQESPRWKEPHRKLDDLNWCVKWETPCAGTERISTFVRKLVSKIQVEVAHNYKLANNRCYNQVLLSQNIRLVN